jgi:hypothetical protein
MARNVKTATGSKPGPESDWDGGSAPEGLPPANSSVENSDGAEATGGPAELGVAPQASVESLVPTLESMAVDVLNGLYPDGLTDNYVTAMKDAERLEATPVKTKLEANIRGLVVRILRAHSHALQQGLPQVSQGADDLVNAPGLKNVHAERIALRARGDRDIAALLEMNEVLQARIDKLQAGR